MPFHSTTIFTLAYLLALPLAHLPQQKHHLNLLLLYNKSIADAHPSFLLEEAILFQVCDQGPAVAVFSLLDALPRPAGYRHPGLWSRIGDVPLQPPRGGIVVVHLFFYLLQFSSALSFEPWEEWSSCTLSSCFLLQADPIPGPLFIKWTDILP